MSTRQLLNRNSYVVVAGLVLVVAAYFVARTESVGAWLAWILAAALLYAGFFALRPGRGSALGETELEKLIGGGTPVLLQLFSNY